MKMDLNFLENLISNLLANVVFWLATGLVVWLSIRITRARFLKFFGLTTRRTLVVYLSNLWQPHSEKPYTCTISGQEFRVVKVFYGSFGSPRFRFPDLVQGLVDSFWAGDKLKTNIEVSPSTQDSLDLTNNMIVVGGTPKNSVRRYYFGKRLLYLMIDGEDVEPPPSVFDRPLTSRVRVLKGHREGEVIEGEYNFAVVEKVCDETYDTTVFMCAGYRGDSSWAATEYLLRHWRDLYREFGNQGFALCLGFRMSQSYMGEYEEPVLRVSFPC